MLQNLFWQSVSGAGDLATSAKQEDGAGAILFPASIGIFMYSNCIFFWQVPTSTQEDKEEGEEGAQSSPEEFHLAKPRIKDWKSGPGDFQLWWGWGHERRGSAVISKQGSRHSWLKVTLEKWQKAMKCYDWSLWWCIPSNLWWQLIVRSWPETKTHQVFGNVESYIWLFPTKVTLSRRNFQSGPRFGMASQSYGCCGSWNGSCCWWLSQILQEVRGGRVDWSKMTSDRGTGQIQPKIVKINTFA